jgi:hypothetical protein
MRKRGSGKRVRKVKEVKIVREKEIERRRVGIQKKGRQTEVGHKERECGKERIIKRTIGRRRKIGRGCERECWRVNVKPKKNEGRNRDR